MIGPWPHVFSATFPGREFRKGFAGFAAARTAAAGSTAGSRTSDDSASPAHPVRIFVMGINQWRDEDEWPLARARNEKFYLESGGQLGSKPRPALLSPDTFVYDPRNPVPTMGGAVCCDPRVFPWGPMDQRPVEKRRDVLVYSTAPLHIATPK